MSQPKNKEYQKYIHEKILNNQVNTPDGKWRPAQAGDRECGYLET
jgi:hypothetical protein